MYNLDIFNKYLEIKQDLVNNFNDVFNRYNYYTKKYRGNVVTDINVGLIEEGNGVKTIQIYIKNRGRYIKDITSFNSSGIISSDFITNIYDDEEGQND